MKHRALWVAWLIILSFSHAASAQSTRLTLVGGRMTYDAAGDQAHTLIGLSIDRLVRPGLRVGVGSSTVAVGPFVGDPILLAAPADSGNERLSRFFGSANLTFDRLLGKSGRFAPWVEVRAGVVHSSGHAAIALPLDEAGLPPEEQFYGPLVAELHGSPTGPAVGGGIGLDARIITNLGLRGGLTVWQDYIYGGGQSDVEEFVGLSASF